VRQRKLGHYRATVELGRDAGIAEALCQRVEELLDEAEARSSGSPRRAHYRNGAAFA
jgi:hypothetical protein